MGLGGAAASKDQALQEEKDADNDQIAEEIDPRRLPETALHEIGQRDVAAAAAAARLHRREHVDGDMNDRRHQRHWQPLAP